MLFTLRVQDRNYTTLGVVVTERRILRTPINNGVGTLLTYYLYDGSSLYGYDIQFNQRIKESELQYMLASAINKKFYTEKDYKDNLTKLGVYDNTVPYLIFQHGLQRTVITSIVEVANGIVMKLFDIEVVSITHTLTQRQLYENPNISRLAVQTRTSPEKVVMRVMRGAYQLDGQNYTVDKQTLQRIGIDYEVAIL